MKDWRYIWLLNLVLLGLGNVLSHGSKWWFIIGVFIQWRCWTTGTWGVWLLTAIGFSLAGTISAAVRETRARQAAEPDEMASIFPHRNQDLEQKTPAIAVNHGDKP